MCGRYTQTADLKTLKARFGFVSGPEALKPRYNIAPTQEAPVLIHESGPALRLFRWGMIPSWAKDPAIGHKLINARSETIMEKPSFKRPFQKSRCLIVADGFYEWRKEPSGKGKTPMRIVMKSREPFAMAGLWDTWQDPAGKETRSFTIITTAAASSIKDIHDRMPVILKAKDEAAWLDLATKPDFLQKLMLPCADEIIESYPISSLVNSPANDTLACIIRDIKEVS